MTYQRDGGIPDSLANLARVDHGCTRDAGDLLGSPMQLDLRRVRPRWADSENTAGLLPGRWGARMGQRIAVPEPTPEAGRKPRLPGRESHSSPLAVTGPLVRWARLFAGGAKP